MSEILVCKLLQENKDHRMGEPGNRNVNETHSPFVDDLKQHHESQ